MIVKFQKSIFGGNKVLIYDRKRTILQEIPLSKELNKMFDGRYKMYRKCSLDKDGILNIGREVRALF